MLTALIPTYNYDIYPLVVELESQLRKANIVFEILCIDDGSLSDLNKENQKINALKNSLFIENKTNIGRSAIRNLLAKKAKHEWLLFLDADTQISNKKFIENYIDEIKPSNQIVYGGICYQKNKPKKNQMLRWVYGNKREALNVTQRNKDKYLRFLTLNFLIKKSVFDQVKFNESIPNSRHEDTLFAYDLKRSEINILHINNPVYHMGIETSKLFIKKSLESVDSIVHLTNNNLIPKKHIKIMKVYDFLKKTFLNSFLIYIYVKHNSFFEKNLLSSRPSLLVFDLYRLSYLCLINKRK
ncbi:glycosyltransferase [Flaviramulus aquimarinus]|uniref:Glycosyltransferase n=1 Tax=Flaviramulus aquimarinus TaxID=1170456 RepID=A0ABP9EYW5_9FLAO